MKRKWMRWKWSEIKQKIVFKSPTTMIVLTSVGLLSILGYFGPLIWKEWQQIEQLKAEKSALELTISDGQARLDAEEPHPMEPLDEDALIRLQEQLPTSQEIPRFMLQIASAANHAGTTLNGIHVARSEEELNERMAKPGLLSEEEKGDEAETEQKEVDEPLEQDKGASDQNREEEKSELLRLDPHGTSDKTDVTAKTKSKLQRVWADVYLQGSYSSLTRFFSQLKQQERLTEVVEWRYVLPHEDTSSHIRVRLNVLYYKDDRLTNLPPLPELDIPVTGGSPIDILPEEPQPAEEESETPERDDVLFFPYPFVPNEDGTGWVPYPWTPGDEFPWKEEGVDGPALGNDSLDTVLPEDGRLEFSDSTTSGMKESDK